MPVICPTCSSDDLDGEVQPDGTRILRCGSCGHRWSRERTAAARRGYTPPPGIDALQGQFPRASDVRPEVLERVAQLREQFLEQRPVVDEDTAAYRARYRFLFSEEGLPTAPPEELYSFTTTATVANAGRMATFSTTWERVGPERAARQLRRTIEHLLRGPGREEDRIDQLVVGTHQAAFPGFKEALLTKVLVVAHPDRFLPVLKYTAAVGGKKEIAERVFGLELPAVERTQRTLGRLIVWSNDLLKELVEPHFDDLQLAAQFLAQAKNQSPAAR
ncbi:hypothetical protein [Trujillonella endophytica]|uniref:Uncharacterized protein n=1 Tax=Trujillonella endophytica TaxID=673521 RepID=A0A1H8VUP7_9ACTN|nr:hypothetical protein [Trujillella endophytica]SEP19162.1 hypothetical protein SAMN05660991_03789 [Trujillella endophytica]